MAFRVEVWLIIAPASYMSKQAAISVAALADRTQAIQLQLAPARLSGHFCLLVFLLPASFAFCFSSLPALLQPSTFYTVFLI